ncbi:uncharacterized protein ATC70_005368 [Mucor velutinosus]|uniref:Uncharacterized protein n=1 Tax=Mucor velutinosus TaxID=708070 RepID=A0AAN7DEN9_9FUNG|nr:hypothetical protein ATC70_005368 [Mucor velutinosus]
MPNAITVEKFGVGMRLDYRSTQQEVSALIATVVEDALGQFQRNTDKFKALTQIKSKHGALRGADVVEEEALFTHENGTLNYRLDAKARVSWIKVHHLNMHAVVLSITVLLAYTVYRLAKLSSQWISTSSSKAKLNVAWYLYLWNKIMHRNVWKLSYTAYQCIIGCKMFFG